MKALEDIFNIMKDSKILLPIAKAARNIIYNRVKNRKGVTSDSSESPSQTTLRPLSSSYIAWRKGQLAFFRRQGKNGNSYIVGLTKKQWEKISPPELGEFGNPSRSNLTLSGQMLSSMDSRVRPDGTIEVFIPNTIRQPIRRVGGPPIPNKTGLTNAQLAQMVADQGRPFFALTDGETRIITKQYEDAIKAELKKIFD